MYRAIIAGFIAFLLVLGAPGFGITVAQQPHNEIVSGEPRTTGTSATTDDAAVPNPHITALPFAGSGSRSEDRSHTLQIGLSIFALGVALFLQLPPKRRGPRQR